MSVSSSVRLKAAVVGILSVTAVAAPSLAQQRVAAPAQAAPELVVMLCDVDALSQPAFRSVNGARPVFVTADEVLGARAAGQSWSAPRCMTPTQHQRLTQRMGLRGATALAAASRTEARL